MKFFAHMNGTKYEIDLREEPGHLVARVGKQTLVVALDDAPGAIRTAFVSGGKSASSRKIEFGWTRKENVYNILIDGVAYEVAVHDPKSEQAETMAQAREEAGGPAEVRAPIPGRITRILQKEGAKVTKGQAILTLDAMKLENEIPAPRDGTVSRIAVQKGVIVDKGQLLFTIK